MDQQFIDALHEQDKIDQLVVDLDLAQYDNVVLSVNNKTGAVVLVTTDIAEGTNLYYTNARADERVALLIDDALTNLTKAWSGQKVADSISAGVVASAAKWTNVMNFDFGGDLVGNGGFDGSSTATFSATVPGKVDNARVLTDVPAGALFTDTAYDDTTIWAAVNLNTAKTGITASQAAEIEANNAKNSYPVEDQLKLSGIADGANVNVQSDWNATEGDAHILNKPETATSGVGWVRFPDGTQICYGSVMTHPVADDATLTRATYAQAFISNPNVTVTANTSVPGATFEEATVINSDVGGTDIVVYRTNDTETEVHYIAVGRWK